MTSICRSDSPPLVREPLHDRRGEDDLPGLGLAGHAVRGVHGRAEDVAILEHDRSEVAADADRDAALPRRVEGVRRCRAAFAGGVHRVVRVREGREDLVADGLDHDAAVAMRGRASGRHRARPCRAPDPPTTRRGAYFHDVREQDGDLRVFAPSAQRGGTLPRRS